MTVVLEPDLALSVSKYVSTARALLERDAELLISAVRADFEPLPASVFDSDGLQCRAAYEAQAAGWTLEGAISREVHVAAFFPEHEVPPPGANACEAERMRQVYHEPAENVVQAVGSVLSPPQPAEVREKALAAILSGVRTQTEGLPELMRPTELPADFLQLMAYTCTLRGGGMPGVNGGWMLVKDYWYSLSEKHDIMRWFGMKEEWEVVCAWRIGVREKGEAFYMFCRRKAEADSMFRWRIFDRWDIETEIHDTLANYIDASTEVMQKWLTQDAEDRKRYTWLCPYAEYPCPDPEAER